MMECIAYIPTPFAEVEGKNNPLNGRIKNALNALLRMEDFYFTLIRFYVIDDNDSDINNNVRKKHFPSARKARLLTR